MDMNLGDTQLILSHCRRAGLSIKHTAYVLATAKWETNHTMKPVREAYWLSEEWRKKNLRYYPWYGRGYVQLTWQENYIAAGRKLGLDLTSDPDEVMKPQTAARILVEGCKGGWFTTKKLSDYATYEDMRRVVNGTDKAKQIADIARQYEAVLVGGARPAEKPVPVTDKVPATAVASKTPLYVIGAIIAAVAAYLGFR